MIQKNNTDHVESVNILLVDDLIENLTALENLLNEPDYNLIRATSGKEALRHLMEKEFALIIMDIQMPEMDGFELARLIKGNKKTKEIPIICVSAFYTDEKDIEQGFEIGAWDYLSKPIKPILIQSKVALYVNLYKKTESIKRQLESHEKTKKSDKIEIFKTNDTIMQQLLPEYRELLIKYIRAIRIKEKLPSEDVKLFAKKISDYHFKAKDIINLHVQVLEEFTKSLFVSDANAFALDARLLLLELMGTICDLRLS
ncbi:histidine kinase [Candidatus Magnetomorum sp. HK-1]|nr:histidine kinase [Candidatus Magnetomorum sp. HK-1]